ncbi:MAG: bifunctional tetrahydrofolate synthase/dihydrofolate synthase [Gammaproteobacteria bacterium]
MTSSGYDLAATSAPDARTPLSEWLSWLEAGRGVHIDLGLDRCREVAARLGLDRPAPQVVTVAGTNGKGSSVALLETIWRRAGLRVGAYTSPHLVRYNERIRIGGAPVADAPICAAFARVEAARGDVPLTYFEFATLAALLIFGDTPLDVVILEVGLGGRLDAVNIIDADVALITAIGLDHEDWLGDTREKIGREKAGIMRGARPAVCSDHMVPATIPEIARTLGAELALLGVDFGFDPGDGDDTWDWWDGDTIMKGLPRPALAGLHQLRNAAGVLAVIARLRDALPVSETAIRAGLSGLVLPGRFHRVAGRFEYVMDVAHNPQAAEIFTATLAASPSAGRTHAIVGMLRTKDHVGFLRPLLEVVDGWHFADLPEPAGAPADELAHCLGRLDASARPARYADVAAAHAGVLAAAAPGDRILVLGSFLTVGAMLRLFDDAGWG